MLLHSYQKADVTAIAAQQLFGSGVKLRPVLHEAFEPFVQFIPRTADSVSLTASCLEDDLKRFPLFAALTLARS
jgi:hypothetical protein